VTRSIVRTLDLKFHLRPDWGRRCWITAAAVLGVISGIGGSMVRDVVTAQVPTVLRAEIYAAAAMAGALVVV